MKNDVIPVYCWECGKRFYIKIKNVYAGQLNKLIIMTIILLLFSVMVSAKLVEKLRFKHYGQGTISIDTDNTLFFDSAIEWNRDFLIIWVEDGKLFVETQDGKWYIEMKEIKKGSN
jgi:hypothetical protein